MKHVVRKPVLQNAIGGDSHPGEKKTHKDA
jgi:hypothetical protein